jgi:hypothetical protein
LCKHLSHKGLIGQSLGEGAHVLEVARRKAVDVRERTVQVTRQPIDHLGTPTLGRLTRQDVSAYLPVQQHQFALHPQHRPLLGSMDAVLCSASQRP